MILFKNQRPVPLIPVPLIPLLGTTVFGIISGWLYWRTRSLIPSMIIHMVNNSTACILEMVAPDYEPGKIASVAFIVAFLPILIYGLKWFKGYGYKSHNLIAV